ncbi:DNA endonuclease [Enterococcus phage EC55P1]|nr:DNA endonuclease [Enterococcus phage EC55P1]
MREDWRPIKGFPFYEVSNLGNVKSLKYGKVRLLKPYLSSSGYLYVDLCGLGEPRKTVSVHRIVAETFIPNNEGLPQVNHKDENPLNNYSHNLEWCTQLYNMQYGTRTKRASRSREKPVTAFNKNQEKVYSFKSIKEAALSGFDASSISKCCKGKLKSHSGLIWEYGGD